MINVIYRPCGAETEPGHYRIGQQEHRPFWFNKETIYKSILISLINAKQYIDTFYIFYDGEFKGEFYNFILNSFDFLRQNNINFEFREIHQNSVFGSVKYSTTFACEQKQSFYIVEDDYLHKSDSILKMVKALPKYKLLTGYDHVRQYKILDEYSLGGYKVDVDFDFESNIHWRTTKSVGHTYMVSKELVDSVGDIFCDDQSVRSDWDLWKTLHQKNIPVWAAVPGIVTQVDPWMSPGVDWEFVNNLALNFSYE